jgi:hypothetical protein
VAYALELNIDALKTDLEKYRIFYDIWFRESELHNSGAVKETIDLFVKNGHTYEKDGALWFKATDFGEEKDEVVNIVRSSIGTPCGNEVKNLAFKAGDKTIVQLKFEDDMKHAIKLKAYELK